VRLSPALNQRLRRLIQVAAAVVSLLLAAQIARFVGLDRAAGGFVSPAWLRL
jgi:hypothetical protein